MSKVICGHWECIWNAENPPECHNEEIIVDVDENGDFICRMFETVTGKDADNSRKHERAKKHLEEDNNERSKS